jgi:hypothetical protein
VEPLEPPAVEPLDEPEPDVVLTFAPLVVLPPPPPDDVAPSPVELELPPPELRPKGSH